jgi:sugar lactone lactonase YvrE
MTDTEVLAGGFGFPESPRWHDDRLFLSDMATKRVSSIDLGSGETATVLDAVPGRPSGLTWDEEGRLLVVSMGRSTVFRDDGGERLATFADLSAFAGGWRNDAVRHPDGWLYVGALGAEGGGAAAPGLAGPNGMAITPDGGRLVVDEYDASRLTAFTIGADGSLTDPTEWATEPGWQPDGCCMDAEGAVWVASAGSPLVRRVAEGGKILDEVVASQPAYACMLAGPGRRTLCICTAPGPEALSTPILEGCIEVVDVPVPGAGWP